MTIKKINGKIFGKRKGDIYRLIDEGLSSRRNSWITMRQIENEYPQFFNKISEILYYDFNDKAKDFARSILTFLELWGFISWKQFDSILSICRTYAEYKECDGVYTFQGMKTVKKCGISFTYIDSRNFHLPYLWTDKNTDRLYERIFGHPPVFEEELEEGMEVAYRPDGSRMFLLPKSPINVDEMLDYPTRSII